MKAFKITDKVYWVGAIDWGLRDFHGYATKRGSTYNAFLILSDKPVLIDTVKEPFYDEMIERISSVIDPKKIEIIISNHSEMDHSGSIPKFIKEYNPKEVYASPMGVKALKQHFGDIEVKAVKTGDKIDIGTDVLSFLEAKMIHWPDSMISFLEGEKILFSNDIFGMHLASNKRYTDEVDDWRYEAEKYYANIVLPYSDIVLKFLDVFEKSDIKPKIIAPDHGPMWRQDIDKIVKLYRKYAEQKPTNKAVVIYDTMWNSTKQLAYQIADGLSAGGAEVRVMNSRQYDRSDIVTELLTSGIIVMGSPVINNGLFPAMADILTYLKGLKKKNLIGTTFGSYGWAPGGMKDLEKFFEEMNVEKVEEPLYCNYVPTEEDLKKAYELGKRIAEKRKGK